jgi:hypothetical protein
MMEKSVERGREQAREFVVLDNLISGYKGSPIVDTTNLIAIRSASIPELAVRMWLDKRSGWLDWLTMTQRKWQRKARHVHGAKHHDSLTLREKHVRCYKETDEVPLAYEVLIPSQGE